MKDLFKNELKQGDICARANLWGKSSTMDVVMILDPAVYKLIAYTKLGKNSRASSINDTDKLIKLVRETVPTDIISILEGEMETLIAMGKLERL